MTAALAMQMQDMQEMDGMMSGMTSRSTIWDCCLHPQPPHWRPDPNAVSISLLRNEAQPALVVRHEQLRVVEFLSACARQGGEVRLST